MRTLPVIYSRWFDKDGDIRGGSVLKQCVLKEDYDLLVKAHDEQVATAKALKQLLKDIQEKYELIECAKCNFENFTLAFPMAAEHLYYKIAKAQLDEGLGYKTVEEKLK